VPELFTVPLQELTLADLEAFLGGAESEPLLWEAKGTKLDPHEVRRQVAGFANSHQGGYLILGAREDAAGGWTVDGFEFPDGEPHRTITDYVHGGLRPVPAYDVRAFDVGDGRHVAVVEVQPLDAGPCIDRGTVVERVSGSTRAVKDPARLAELFSRGERAHARAAASARSARQAAAATAASAAPFVISRQDRSLLVVLGMATVVNAADASARLFRASTRDRICNLLDELRVPGRPYQPESRDWVGQDRRVAIAMEISYDPDWGLVGFWDGSVGVFMSGMSSGGHLDSVVDNAIVVAYERAKALVRLLGGAGPAYLDVAVVDPGVESLEHVVEMSRGPFDLGTSPDWAHLRRELQRAAGHDFPEPEADA
jgi:hypothetical protein